MEVINFMKKLIFTIFISLFFIGCFDDGGGSDNSGVTTPVIKTYSGKLEKGAFQQGAEIIAYGWDSVEGFTGESFTTNTTDDLGNYSLTSTKIKDILYVKAEGYFYNENTNTMSDSTLKLYGMVDSTKVPWNINVLTHIIQPRVMALLQSGDTYNDAVNQAIGELFAPLNWSSIDPGTQSVANNANLLFFSSAICKNRTVSQISDILTTLANDLADGSIDISVLDSSFQAVDTAEVEANMTAKYGSSPDIDAVKSQILTYRNLEDITIRQITMIPVSTATFYTYVNGSLKGFINSELVPLYVSYEQTYMGETTTVNCQINDFFSITDSGIKTLYMQVTFSYDSSVKYFSQTGGELAEVSSLPEKPTFNTPLEFETADFIAELVNGDTAVNLTAKNTGFALMNNYLYQYIETTDYVADGVSYGPGIFAVWNNSTGTNGRIIWMSADTYDSYFGNVVQGNVNIW